MHVVEIEEINYMLLLSIPCAFGIILMLRDSVIKIMTFVKGLNLD